MIIAGGVIVLAFGFLLWKGLGTSTVYFKTADQAVASKASLGDKRFRIEGTVQLGSVVKQANYVDFVIKGDKDTVAVQHRGDEPELFKEGIPVVLEGKFVGDTFHSDRILVKHSETYTQANPDRVKDYNGK